MKEQTNEKKLKELVLLCIHNGSYGALIITFMIMLTGVLSMLFNKDFKISVFVKEYSLKETAALLIYYPIGEELIFRGLLLSFLKKRTKYANLIQGILFGIIHLNPVKIIYTSISGIVYGNIKLKGSPLWIIVIIHSVFNLTAVFLYKPLILILEKTFHLERVPLITLAISFIFPLILFVHSLRLLKKEFYEEKGLYKIF